MIPVGPVFPNAGWASEEEKKHHEVTFTGGDRTDLLDLPAFLLQDSRGTVITRWTLTAEERRALGLGADIMIQHLTGGDGVQPLMPYVEMPLLEELVVPTLPTPPPLAEPLPLHSHLGPDD